MKGRGEGGGKRRESPPLFPFLYLSRTSPVYQGVMPATYVALGAHLWLQATQSTQCVGLVTFCLFSHIPQVSLFVIT